MSILIFIIFGAIVGWIASMLVGSGQGLLMDIIVGIIGSVLGNWLMGHFGEPGVSGLSLYSFLVAILGAVVLLIVLRLLRRL